MNLATVFQLSIYGLTGLAGAMLAYGEGTPFPAGLTVFFSIVAWFFNEQYRTIRIRLMWCNLLGLVAMGFAVHEFLGDNIEARLLAGAHFLVYLTWIVLFQDKRVPQYWWLFALGLLQVAVGSVLTNSGWYGLFLLVYLLLALWTMALFHLYQGALAFGAEGLDATVLLDEAAPVVSRSSAARTANRRAAVLAGDWVQPATAFDRLPQTIIGNAIQQDVRNHWITPRYISGVTAISVSGLLLGLVMFLLVPRFWVGSGNPFTNRADAAGGVLSGFTSEVRLGHLGRILESNEPVLQMRLYDQKTDASLRLEDFAALHGLEEPLFRGSVLDTYKGGGWSKPVESRSSSNMQSHPGEAGMYRQEYLMSAKGTEVLFCLCPINLGRLVPYQQITIDRETSVLSQQSDRDPIEYYVYSRPSEPRERGPTIMPGQSAHVLPLGSGPRGRYFRGQYLNLPPEGLERMKTLAADWTNPERLAGDGRLSDEARKALTLERRLRDSGEYTYSLNMTVIDSKSDPVEDFLFNRKQGHCEYYASALALMLRAVAIPSRLITGFKGAEYVKSREGYYEVQQRHAHAWVEAFIDDEWMVLDATPGDREESVESFGANSNFWHSARSSLSSFWSTYVVSMTYSRQKEALYDPIAGGVNSLKQAIAWLKNGVLWLRELVNNPQQLLSWRGAGLVLSLIGIPALGLWLAQKWRAWRKHHHAVFRRPSAWRLRWHSMMGQWWGEAPGTRVVVQFYQRFLELASTRGLRPQSHQTHREFANQVEQTLAEALHLEELAMLPADVTELYYRVRFGGAHLPNSEILNLENRMRQFADRLQPGPPTPGRV